MTSKIPLAVTLGLALASAAGSAPAHHKSAAPPDPNLDLAGVWTVLGADAATGPQLTVSNPEGPGEIACALTPPNAAAPEPCFIERRGQALVITSRGPTPSVDGPIPTHLFLAEVSGGLMTGRLYPAPQPIKLYRQGGQEAEQRLAELAAEAAKRAEQKARFEAARHALAQQLQGEWRIDTVYYGGHWTPFPGEGTMRLSVGEDDTATGTYVYDTHPPYSSGHHYEGEITLKAISGATVLLVKSVPWNNADIVYTVQPGQGLTLDHAYYYRNRISDHTVYRKIGEAGQDAPHESLGGLLHK